MVRILKFLSLVFVTVCWNQGISAEDEWRRITERNNATRVIVLGNTGSGKSSLVHALVGKSMDVRKKNGKCILEVKPEDKIPGFVVSGGVEAGTRRITSHLHHLDDRNAVVFWDCPGFLDPRGLFRDMLTSFAIEWLFAPPCSIKVFLILDRDSFDINRSRDVILRLKKLSDFFRDEEELKQAVSIIVTKQLWDDEDINPLDSGAMLVRIFRNIQNPSEVGLSPYELENIRSIIVHLRDNGRIFSFPRPKCVGIYNYAEFPDKSRILEDMRHSVTRATYSNFDSYLRIFYNRFF